MKARFGIITDAHMGPKASYKGCNRLMSTESPRVLPIMVDKLNQEPDLEFVIQLGDLVQDSIENPSREEDTQNLRKALSILKGLKAPLYHTVGNHCSANLLDEDLKSAFGYKELYYGFESSSFHNIVLYSQSVNRADIKVPAEQVAWLRQELQRANKPVLVFLHHPLVECSLENSFWFKGAPEQAFVQNSADVRAVIKASGKVRAVFNGHMHAHNFLISDGVPYFTLQSMIEDHDMDGRPCEDYAIVTIDDKSVDVDIRGGDPAHYSHSA